MSVRRAVVAGQFYPGKAHELRAFVESSLARAQQGQQDGLEPGESRPLLIMLPHAGYVYCGNVIAATLAGLALPRRMVILAPSHTGMGHPLGCWGKGAWQTPLGDIPVDEELAQELIALGGGFVHDVSPHLREHDIEVLLPFLQVVRPDLSILPIVVGSPDGLSEAAHALAVLARQHGGGAKAAAAPDNRPVPADGPDSPEPETDRADDGSIAFILSSDMNHYASDAENRRQDALALEALLALKPQRLWDVTRRHGISMCGILPALMGLLACRELGANRSRLAAYDTSASASGDASRVVGYAGIHIWQVQTA